MEESDRRLFAALGAEIRRLRHKAGRSQADLADRSDITQKYLCEIEAGKRNPSLACLRHICAALGIKPSRLLRDLGI